jgi:two-component system phosphate regulon sensor histidine kinase PhoR
VKSRPWAYVLVRLVLIIGAAVGAGLIFGYPLAWVLGSLIAYLGWHLYHLYLLERWLRIGGRQPPRDAPGIWGTVYAELYHLRSRHRERKKRLSRLVKEFRKSTKALPDAIVVLNADHEIAWVNRSAGDLLGLTKGDRGQPVDNLIRDPVFVDRLRSGGLSRPVRIQSPAQRDVSLMLQEFPYGKRQRLLIGKNVTAEERLEKVRRSFVANASHELRSPLTVVSGYLESLIEDDELPEGWRDPVLEMGKQTGRMHAIIEDLLTLSRLETAEAEAEREPVDVAGMLALVRKDALSSSGHPCSIELQLDCSSGLLGAESEIYSVISNLVSNALKYTPPEGTVAMRWWCDDLGAHFSVTDTGVGIPAEAIPRLTERFYRVDKGRERSSGGTGLGLAIVKHALQRHGAVLEIESELGAGSRFVCHFPKDRLALECASGDAQDGPDSDQETPDADNVLPFRNMS